MDNYDSESYKVISERTFSAAESLTEKKGLQCKQCTHMWWYSQENI